MLSRWLGANARSGTSTSPCRRVGWRPTGESHGERELTWLWGSRSSAQDGLTGLRLGGTGLWLEGYGLDTCNSRSACLYVANEDVLPCIKHVLVHMELVAGGDEELPLCSVDLLKVGTTHPCPRLVGVCITVKGIREGAKVAKRTHSSMTLFASIRATTATRYSEPLEGLTLSKRFEWVLSLPGALRGFLSFVR